MRQHRTLNVQFDTGSARSETLQGRDYYVVPCVAMVEGVRFGANQEEPELGLAAEFGDLPISWANRPLVLNHPKINGVYVSANQPGILESWQFGVTMNPELVDKKLKMEAWIDETRVLELGGEFETTLQRIKDKKPVEVSVGFFSDVEQKKGKYKNQVYNGIWRQIKPDHLAVLSEDSVGACSVDDGCGIPRINKGGTMTQPIKPNADPTAQCSCGGAHTQEEHTDDEAPVTQKGLKKLLADMLKPFTQSAEDKALEAHTAQRGINQTIVNQAIDPSMMSRDVHNMISQALTKKFGGYTYLYGFTQNEAIYETYVSSTGSFTCYSLGVNVKEDSVEFVGEPKEVLLQTKIVTPKTNEGVSTTIAETRTQENDMTDTSVQTPPAAAANPPAVQPAPEVAPVTQAEKPKVLTAQEYIDSAPPEIQALLSGALKAQNAKKDGFIATLKAHKSNRFTEEFLKAQPIEVLENMVALLPGDYAGQAPATQTRVEESANSGTVALPKIQWGAPRDATKSNQAA